MNISIVLPAKNEDASIGPLVLRLREAISCLEIIVVNDGSTDSTAMEAERAGARVISHPYSKGNGAAIKTGARAARGEVIVFLDADGQHDPIEIPRMIAKLSEGYDMVVGARTSKSQASVGRSFANRGYNALASYMTGQRVKDLTSGFRVVRAERFREFLYLLPNGFSYPTTITMAFFRAGYSVAYLEIEASRREGKSHIKPLSDGVRFFLIIFKVGSLYSPLKLFFPISASIFLVGVIYYLYTFLTIHRFTNMSALLFTGAVMVFLMGLISEQITMLMYRDHDDARYSSDNSSET